MKKIYCLVILFAFLHTESLWAQICDPITPVFTADLSGSPGGTWISPSVVRDGFCCSAVSPDVCIQFIVTLDSAAVGINFDIASGAVPPGALYYQINCGPPIAVGQPICLNGAGPHLLTFCKPGNNKNSYSISSLTEPDIKINVNHHASPQCFALLTAQGVDEANLTWTSVPPNALFNSYLSCTTGCDTVTVTPSGSFPPYVDYMVCVNPVGPCATADSCDIVRVFFIQDVSVSVSPANVTLCNGVTTTNVSATASGGSGSYQYLWSNGQTTSGINVGAGTYTVIVTDTAVCSPATAVSTINVLPPIVANAGSDITVCANQPSVNLNGSIQTATAALWTGGTGTFNPNNATLNVVYTPSATEITNGYADLILQTTANQGCPADYDTIHITIAQPPSPTITGNSTICANSISNYSVSLVAGCSYEWTVTGGTINGSSNSNSISVTWGSNASGTVSVTMTNSFGCTSTDSKMVALVVLPNPVITGSNTMCQYSSSVYSVASSPGSTYSWAATNGTISGNNTGSSVQVNWNSYGSGSVSVTEINSYGCTRTFNFTVTIFQQPIPLISGSSIGCVNGTASTYTSSLVSNTTYSWSVTGGTIQSSNGTNAVSILWNTGGTHSLTLTVSNANGCDSTTTFPVNVASLNPPSVLANGLKGCPPFTVTFSGNGPAQGQTYVWTFGDYLYSSSANPSHTYNEPGIYEVVLITKNTNGCADTANATVQVYSSPQASFNHNYEGQTYIIGEGSLDITNTTSGASGYLWTFGTSDTSVAFEPTYTYTMAGDYIIELYTTNTEGCINKTSKEIRVRNNELIYIPNAFSPNGDNVNDYFSMLYSSISEASVSIFNRWGQSIFTSDDKDFKWNGTCHGKAVELGVYVYKINAKGEGGKDYSRIGTIALVR